MKNKPEQGEFAIPDKLDITESYLNIRENPNSLLKAKGQDLRIFEEVIEDIKIAGYLDKRADLLISYPYMIEPADDSQKEMDIAHEVQENFQNIQFDEARKLLSRAIVTGFYLLETIWDYSEGQVSIKRLLEKKPHRFVFDRDRKLRFLKDHLVFNSVPVPEKKFIIHRHGSLDNPYGEGRGVPLWWSMFLRKGGVKFWAQLLDRFGGPTAVGKFGPNFGTSEKNALREALEAFRTQNAIMIPEGANIDLLEASLNGAVSFEDFCRYFDEAALILLLGETLSTQIGKTGGAFAAAKIQKEAGSSIIQSDAVRMARSINETIVRWLVDFNHGKRKKYPVFKILTEEKEDLVHQAERDHKLFQIGVRFKPSYFEKCYNLKDHLDQESMENPEPKQENNSNAEYAEKANSPNWLEEGLNDWQKITGQNANQIEKLLQSSKNYEEFQGKLPGLLKSFDTEKQTKNLALGQFKAHMQGKINE